MKLRDAIKEAEWLKLNEMGLLDKMFPEDADTFVWRYDTEPSLFLMLAAGGFNSSAEIPMRYLEIWSAGHGFHLQHDFENYKRELEADDWRIDVFTRDHLTTVQALVMAAGLKAEYEKLRRPFDGRSFKCYYNKR